MAFRRAEGVLAQVVDGRAMLIAPAGTEVIVLNRTGSALWEALAEPGDVTTLVETLQTAHPTVDPTALTNDVTEFLDDLSAAGLIAEQ